MIYVFVWIMSVLLIGATLFTFMGMIVLGVDRVRRLP